MTSMWTGTRSAWSRWAWGMMLRTTATPSSRRSSTEITYTPNAGFSGDDTFTYMVSDGTAAATGTVNVTVKAEEEQNLVAL